MSWILSKGSDAGQLPEILTFSVPDAKIIILSIVVSVAQLVRALDCGSRGWGFETPHSPLFSGLNKRFYSRVVGLEKCVP